MAQESGVCLGRKRLMVLAWRIYIIWLGLGLASSIFNTFAIEFGTDTQYLRENTGIGRQKPMEIACTYRNQTKKLPPNMTLRSKAKSSPKLCDDETNPFINITSPQTANGATRKLIRRHVMRGKNCRKPSSPQLKYGRWINADASSEEGHAKGAGRTITLSNPRTEFSGSGLSTFSYSDKMQPYMFNLISKFFNILLKAVYPIELCLSFNPHSSIYFQYLQSDVMYLHSQMWLSQTYFDWISGQGPSHASLLHESKTLNLLRIRIEDPKTSCTDETILVVVTLISMTTLAGKNEEARKHMRGLYKMVQVRGGLKELNNNPQLQLKICRADLSTALQTGTKPLFFSNLTSISWDPFLPQPNRISPPRLNITNEKLANIYQDLSNFTLSANLASQLNSPQQKLNPELFQETLISLLYRLLNLDYQTSAREPSTFLGNVSLEILEISILAFATNVFLQTRGIKIEFGVLNERLRSIMEGKGFKEIDKHVRIWVLFVVGIVGVGSEEEGWFVPLLRKEIGEKGDEFKENGSARTETWEGVRRLLKGILWIDALHDEDGKSVFEMVCGDESISQTD